MADNVLQTLQRLVQDVIAPDVRELKVRVNSLENTMNERFTLLQKQSEAQFNALMAAISESRAQSELTSFKTIAALSERVAVLEARQRANS